MRIVDRKRGAESFVRTLHGIRFPRFHVYLEEREEGTYIDLHLDQKQPSYFESHAHNAEYDSPVVVTERDRLLQMDREEKKRTDTRTNEAPHPPSSLWKRLFNRI